MPEVSREAAAAGEEQVVSCAAEHSKYFLICTVTLDPCGYLQGRFEFGDGRLVSALARQDQCRLS
jgi:hypothetical protein